MNESDFPPICDALTEPNGLLATGGDLSPQRLIAAYRHGCFPWFNEGEPILWWSPDPRMVLFPNQLRISKSMAKLFRQQAYHVTYDKAFVDVIRACASPRTYTDQTWISTAIQDAYYQLYQQGVAHSVEVWRDDQLVGGLYGLAMGQLFFGESMFSHASNASKYGFITLTKQLQHAGFVLIDCQVYSEHLHSLGASEIPRKEFSEYLAKYLDQANSMNWGGLTNHG